EAKRRVAERQRRQLGDDVAALPPAGVEVVQERLLARRPDLAQLLDRANRGPDELLLIAARLVEDDLGGRADPLAYLAGGEAIDRVARNQGVPPRCRLRIEARRTVRASQDRSRQVGISEGEHPPILVERPSPGDDLIEREHASIVRRTVTGL